MKILRRTTRLSQYPRTLHLGGSRTNISTDLPPAKSPSGKQALVATSLDIGRSFGITYPTAAQPDSAVANIVCINPVNVFAHDATLSEAPPGKWQKLADPPSSSAATFNTASALDRSQRVVLHQLSLSRLNDLYFYSSGSRSQSLVLI